ncbi:MAG TPA: sigma-54 dependent transcriptional regulator [Bacteroidia bacterium]|nr:sigma-54 dependent transcriptional regulator [Bacteroidia bacterium]
MTNILVIDDDVDICMLLNRYLSKNGFNVTTAYSGKLALENIASHIPDIVLCDFRLEDMNGSDLLEKIKQNNPQVPVIIMTGYSDVRTAVNIMKLGAFDYVTKPLLPEEILLTLKRALAEAKESNGTATTVSTNVPDTDNKKAKKHKGKYVFGKSAVFKVILEQIQLVAPTNFSVIIYGESGSGKESVAAEIHNNSSRANKPFVAIDCGSLSKELASSELFGHEKGSFTSAVSQKVGSFELANGGTVFLDEIGNLSYDIQVALLRVVQERKMRRVGGIKDIDLDVRIIVASNERLSEAAKKGRFREDLYHRFNEFSIEVPALRNRQDDIMMFADFFLEKTNAELNKSVKGFSEEVVKIFHNYNWPGNLRELNNVIKRSTLLTSGDTVEVSALPFEITHFEKLAFEGSEPVPAHASITPQPVTETPKKNLPLSDYGMKHASIDAEFELIVEALKKCNYNKSKAAQLLNIDRKTLYNKMKQYKEFNGDL